MPKAWPAVQRFPRRSLGDGVTTARYDPHTSLLWHRKDALRPQQLSGITHYPSLNHRKRGDVIDLDAASAPVDLIAAFHEQTHWMQFGATSIGALLTSIKMFQHHWVRVDLQDIPARARDKLMQRRRAGQPIFAVDARHGLVLDHLSKDARDFAEIWWEHEVAFAFLAGTLGTPELGGHNIARAMGQVLGFIAADALGAKHDDRQRLGAFIDAYSTSEWNWVQTHKIGVTTFDLLEAGAVVHELTLLCAARDAGVADDAVLERLDERLGQIQTHPYFAAVRTFCRYADIDDAASVVADDRLRRSFLAVLDLALNPPVPPFIPDRIAEQIGNGPGGATVSVKQLHPPLRFLSLCLAFKLLRGHAATPKYADDTADLEEKLCHVSGMIATPHLTEPWPARDVLDLTLLEDDKPALTNMRLLDYFRTVHKRLWNLREASPGFSTSYLEAVTLDDDPKTNDTLLLEHYGGVVQPLVQVGRVGRAAYLLLPAPGLENVKSMVVVKSAYEFLLSDIFGGIGPLSLSSYPAGLQEKATIRESLLVSYADWLGKDTGLEIATS